MSEGVFDFRKLVWSIVTILFSISLVLSLTTAYNYTEIAKARVLLDFSTTTSFAIEEDAGGRLERVNLTIEFSIVNPSQKELRVWILNYKGWLRDLSMEDGTDTSRWTVDGKLPTEDGEQRYYPVFAASYSFDNPQVFVAPGESVTITKYLVLDSQADVSIMQNAASIYNYSKSTGNDAEWLDYSSAIVFITDIEPYSGQDKDANLIRRFNGYDLTPEVGGIGP